MAHSPADTGARALVLVHHDTTPPGLVGDWAQAQGVQLVQVRVDEARAGELPDPAGFQLVASFGSGESAYDDGVSWVPAELDLLRRAAAAHVPVLGICFGAQMLARALGGTVHKAPRPEIGWHAVTSEDPTRIPPGPWFGWHYDTLHPPPGSRVLAHNATGCQAFEIGPHLGLQFHAEVTPDIVRRWIDTWGGDQLAALGLDGQAILGETETRFPRMRDATRTLLDAWSERSPLPSEVR